jgi:hypothetical protein
MREVAEMLGFRNDRGKVGPSQRRRALRWLKGIEKRRGIEGELVFGGGVGGCDCWTTIEAIRSASPNLLEQELALGEEVERLKDRQEDLDARMRNLAAVVGRHQGYLKRVERQLALPL